MGGGAGGQGGQGGRGVIAEVLIAISSPAPTISGRSHSLSLAPYAGHAPAGPSEEAVQTLAGAIDKTIEVRLGLDLGGRHPSTCGLHVGRSLCTMLLLSCQHGKPRSALPAPECTLPPPPPSNHSPPPPTHTHTPPRHALVRATLTVCGAHNPQPTMCPSTLTTTPYSPPPPAPRHAQPLPATTPTPCRSSTRR